MRKCPSCGKVIPLDAVFCGYCGTKISEKFTYAEEQTELKDLISTVKWKYAPLFKTWTSSISEDPNPTPGDWKKTKEILNNFLSVVERIKRLFPRADDAIGVYLKDARRQMNVIQALAELCIEALKCYLDVDDDKSKEELWRMMKEELSNYKREVIRLRKILLGLCDFIISIEKSS